jgi:hypothetical protein
MISPRQTRNGEDASDLVAALLSNVGALHKEVCRLSGDVSRVFGNTETMHRRSPSSQNRKHARENADSAIARSGNSSQTEPEYVGQSIAGLLVKSG